MLTSRYLLVQSQWKIHMFKVKNKDTRRTSVLHLFLISDFEKVNAGSVLIKVLVNTQTLYPGRNYNTDKVKEKRLKLS